MEDVATQLAVSIVALEEVISVWELFPCLLLFFASPSHFFQIYTWSNWSPSSRMKTKHPKIWDNSVKNKNKFTIIYKFYSTNEARGRSPFSNTIHKTSKNLRQFSVRNRKKFTTVFQFYSKNKTEGEGISVFMFNIQRPTHAILLPEEVERQRKGWKNEGKHKSKIFRL